MPQPTFTHERLDVYRLSIDYVAFSYQIAKSPGGTNRQASDQWLRAAQSIPLNIADGNGKRNRSQPPHQAESNPRPREAVSQASPRTSASDGTSPSGSVGFALPRRSLRTVRSSRTSRLGASTAAPDGLAPSELQVRSYPTPPTPPQPPTGSPRRS